MTTPGNYYPEGTDLRYKKISHEEERELFAAARAGDESAREFLIKNHLLFAAMQGRKWAYGKLSEDEVVSMANLALMKAIDKFDHTRPERFTSYLKPFIRGHIANLWRSKNTMGEHAPFFPNHELAVSLSKDTSLFRGDGSLLGIEDHPVEEDDHQRFLLKLLAESKGILTDIEAEVLRRHFSEGAEFLSDIAKEHKLTRARIHQIKEAALKKLRRELARRMKAMGVEK